MPIWKLTFCTHISIFKKEGEDKNGNEGFNCRKLMVSSWNNRALFFRHSPGAVLYGSIADSYVMMADMYCAPAKGQAQMLCFLYLPVTVHFQLIHFGQNGVFLFMPHMGFFKSLLISSM
jgi:hypothetical protein